MAEWLGQVMANWPFWLVVAAVLVMGIVGFFYSLTSYDNPWKKKEWWQDREKRLVKEAKVKQLKMKAKKG